MLPPAKRRAPCDLSIQSLRRSNGEFPDPRLAALSFAILTFAASASLAQGVPALRQAPIGHRQPTPSDLPPDVRKDEQLSRAPSQPASATPQSSSVPSQRQAGRTRGGGPPTLQVGPSCEAAGRGAVVLGRNKEACLADETVRRIRSSKTGPNTRPPTRPFAPA